MQPLITPELLASTGIKIPADQVEAYLELLNDQLTEHIGEAVVDSLNDEQLDELEKLEETASDEELNAWMTANVADLNDIIEEEIEILLGDAVENSSTINSLDA